MTSRSMDDSVDLNKMVRSMSRKLNSFWSVYEPVDMESRHCSIYRVPQHILEVDRIAYEPILVSIGPYHHGAQALQAMEKEKMLYLDWILKLNCKQNLHDYLKMLAGIEKLAKGSYSEKIRLERKTFLRMLLLDGCFILANIVNLARATQETAVGNIVGETSKNSRKQVEDMSTSENMSCGHEYVVELEVDVKHGISRTDVTEHKDAQVSENGNTGDWYSISAWHDMFLLENQIPFFIVEKLYELVIDKNRATVPLTEKAVECVQDVLCNYPKAINKSNRAEKFHHLLHLCHLYLRPSQDVENNCERRQKPGYLDQLVHLGHKFLGFGNDEEQNQHSTLPLQPMDCFQDGQLPGRWRQALQYHGAGVKLKKREYDSNHGHSLLDIRFYGGVLEIPCFPVDESTESFFKNLIAFEQTDPTFGNDVTAYIIFMSQFASTSEDVTLLCEKGIIVHMMDGDDQVSALFMRLTKQVTFDSYNNYYLRSLCGILEEHYQSQLNRWIAWLWHNHFSNPWLALAVLAAVIVLVCTVVQTIYTVLAYLEPPA